jgi:hypothetical protein
LGKANKRSLVAGDTGMYEKHGVCRDTLSLMKAVQVSLKQIEICLPNLCDTIKLCWAYHQRGAQSKLKYLKFMNEKEHFPEQVFNAHEIV